MGVLPALAHVAERMFTLYGAVRFASHTYFCGENVSPAAAETLLVADPLIGQALAYGDRRPCLVRCSCWVVHEKYADVIDALDAG